MRCSHAAFAQQNQKPPMRLLLIGRNLGLHAPFLFPETAGLNYESTRYLRHLEQHRGKFTIFSGVSHHATTTTITARPGFSRGELGTASRNPPKSTTIASRSINMQLSESKRIPAIAIS
jgi:hypothetical protein